MEKAHGSIRRLGFHIRAPHPRLKAALAFVMLAVVLLSSCGAAGSTGYNGGSEEYAKKTINAPGSGAAVADLASETVQPPMEAPHDSLTEIPTGKSGEPLEGEASSPWTPTDRKLVSTGSMDLVVDDLEKAEASIRSSVEKVSGYVSSMNRWSDSFSMTVKVPAEEFDGFAETAAGFGDVRSKQIDVQDVTDRYYDLEHRIRNKEILVERLRGYLERAEDIEEILKVERELNETVTELERLEGSFRNLSHLVAFSTLTLSVRLPSYASDHGPLPSLRDGLKEFGYTAAGVFYSIFFVLMGIIVFGVPSVLVVGLLYWLGFGRIGLIRKFFRRLRS